MDMGLLVNRCGGKSLHPPAQTGRANKQSQRQSGLEWPSSAARQEQCFRCRLPTRLRLPTHLLKLQVLRHLWARHHHHVLVAKPPLLYGWVQKHHLQVHGRHKRQATAKTLRTCWHP